MLDISGIMELLVRKKLILKSDRWTDEKYVYSPADRLCSLQVLPRPRSVIYCFIVSVECHFCLIGPVLGR